MQSNNLRARVLKSGTWTIVGYGLNQSLRLISNLIMTRLLVPEAFGLMALAFSFNYIFTLMSDIGIKQSVIRSENGEKKEFLNTAWTLQIIRGLLITLLTIVIALLLKYDPPHTFFAEDSAFTNPQLPIVMIYLAIIPTIASLSSISMHTAYRDLVIHRVTILEIIAQVVSIIFMVVYAYYYSNIWALVYGSMISAVISASLSHTFLSGIKHRLYWSHDYFKEIFSFGKWLLLSSVLTAIYMQADKIYLGMVETEKNLGFYSIAVLITLAVRQLVSKVSSSVLFSALSEVNRNDNKNLLEKFYKSRYIIDMFCYTVAGVLIITGQDVINILYDDRYYEVGKMLQLMSLSIIVTAPLIVSSSLMLSVGNSKYEAFLRIFQTVSLLILLPILYGSHGLEGVIYATILVPALSYIIDLSYRTRFGLINYVHEFKTMVFLPIGILIGYVISYFIQYLKALI